VKKILLATALALLLAFGAWQMLPERFAVNAPLGQLLFARGRAAPPAEAFGSRIHSIDGLTVGLYASELPGARLLRFTPAGDLLVSQPNEGRVVLLERDADGDGRADGRRDLVTGLRRPHGLDLREGWLYVAETDAVGRIRFDPATRSVEGGFERVVTGIPGGGNHWSRTLRFGPDGWMYLSIGSSCNVCEEEDPRRAALVRYRPDGSQEEIYATGLRNAVGFDWRPGSGELFATDNGRDLLGDDTPPCELNRVVRGGFYGWPYAYGDNQVDPDEGAGHEAEIRTALPPVHGFRAHNAPLGITFVRGSDAPEALRGAALVALHGSWNRTRKDGYKVVSLHWRPDGTIEERDFLVGFLEGEDVIGRPVDVAEGPDGAFYVSDDYAGSIYRVAPASASTSTRSAERSMRRAQLSAKPRRVSRTRGWSAATLRSARGSERAS
jgi:glucose/arabinose dehydrogenase